MVEVKCLNVPAGVAGGQGAHLGGLLVGGRPGVSGDVSAGRQAAGMVGQHGLAGVGEPLGEDVDGCVHWFGVVGVGMRAAAHVSISAARMP